MSLYGEVYQRAEKVKVVVNGERRLGLDLGMDTRIRLALLCCRTNVIIGTIERAEYALSKLNSVLVKRKSVDRGKSRR